MATYDGRVADEAFITLATNDVYARGALVLAESLKKHKTIRQLVVMITPHVSPNARSALENVFDVVRLVDVLDSRDATHLALLKRPELGVTFTKIHCWTFTEYKKCVFMDADMMALQNIDELFERGELSAAPDSGWPDIFNSGLFVFCPSFDTFHSLLLLAENEGSFDGGDQGLLNTYFSNWAHWDISRHLPFLYNLHVSASYQYLPAFKRFGKDTKVVHFLGPVKPWHHVYNRVSGSVEQVPGTSLSGVRHFPEFLKEWWAIYNDKVQSYFSQEQEMKDGRHFIEERKPPTDDEITHGDDAGHQHSETPEQEHHEDQPCHEHSEPPPNPYNWELPASFFKTQPIYVPEEPPPPPPEPHPVIHITPPSTVMLNTQSEPHVELGMTPAEVQKVSTTNVSIPEVYETPTSKPAILHGDPNIIVRAPEYEIVPTEEVILKAGGDEEPQGHMVAQDATSPDRSLTPPQSPTELMTKTPETVENIQLAKIEHMEAWQRGDADYMGRDKFANIQAALDAFLS